METAVFRLNVIYHRRENHANFTYKGRKNEMPTRSGASGEAELRKRQPNEVREGSKPISSNHGPRRFLQAAWFTRARRGSCRKTPTMVFLRKQSFYNAR